MTNLHQPHDAEASVAAARALHRRLDAPNLLVKIPATVEGVAAVGRRPPRA